MDLKIHFSGLKTFQPIVKFKTFCDCGPLVANRRGRNMFHHESDIASRLPEDEGVGGGGGGGKKTGLSGGVRPVRAREVGADRT